MTPEKLTKARALMANGLTAREAVARVKVWKTALNKALAAEDAGLGPLAES